MYREKIDRYIDAHQNEMLEDIAALCRIESTKDSYRAGKPYGLRCAEVLGEALHLGESYGFSINNYDNYVGTIDLNDKEKQIILLRYFRGKTQSEVAKIIGVNQNSKKVIIEYHPNINQLE